jgi:hypothetical protein
VSIPTCSPPDRAIRLAWTMRYNLPRKLSWSLTNAFMRQLSMCRSDEARRLLLGISEKTVEPLYVPELTARRGLKSRVARAAPSVLPSERKMVAYLERKHAAKATGVRAKVA